MKFAWLALWLIVASPIISGCSNTISPSGFSASVPDPLVEQSVPSPGGSISGSLGGELELAEGARLDISPGALDQDLAILFTSEDVHSTNEAVRPFEPHGPTYVVDLGQASQTGTVLIHVPANSSPQSESSPDFLYTAWAAPADGILNIVGVINDGEWLTFPIQGSGRYQIMKLPAPELTLHEDSQENSLVTPPIQSAGPEWAAASALTQIAQMHEGSWPAGGLEAKWGETSPWYLAGKAGLLNQNDRVLESLLEAGGLPSAGLQLEGEFAQPVQMLLWNWAAGRLDPGAEFVPNPAYAQPLLEAFNAYLELRLLGERSAARPVALRDNLGGEVKVLTGAAIDHLIYSDPVSGTSHNRWARDQIAQTVLATASEEGSFTETVIFYTPLQPSLARLGSLILLPESNGLAGSLRLERSLAGPTASHWMLDSSGTWPNGYYYSDLYEQLPSDPAFEHQLNVLTPDDHLVYGYSVANASAQDLDFDVQVELFDERGRLPLDLNGVRVAMEGLAIRRFEAVGKVPLADLAAGEHILKFSLLQDSVVQDIKYLQFQLAVSAAFDREPTAVFKRNAFCRLGPDLAYDDLTAFEAGTRLTVLGFNPERTWVKGQDEIFNATCWVAVGMVDLYEVDFSQVPVLQPPPIDRPVPEDRVAPVVEVTHGPSGPQEPNEYQWVNFSAVASDNVELQRIEIWINGELAIQCILTTSCGFVGGPYPPGQLTYFGRAFDAVDNFTVSDPTMITIWAAPP